MSNHLPERTPGAAQHVRAHRDAYTAGGEMTVNIHTTAPAPPAPNRPGLASLRPPAQRKSAELRGRDAIVARLVDNVLANTGDVQVLWGMGGFGKTAIALSVAGTAADEGLRVWWLPGHNPSSLNSAFRQLALELGIEPRLVDEAWSGQLSAPDLVWDHLWQLPEPWLLVIDEADDPTLLAPPDEQPGDSTGWLRFGTVGAVVVSSRQGGHDVWGDAELHPVRKLPAQAAVELLADGIDIGPEGTGPEWDTAVESVVDVLEGHALSLRLAGSYLRARIQAFERWSAAEGDTAGRSRLVAEYADAARRNIASLDETAATARLQGIHPRKRRLVAAWTPALDELDRRGTPEARTLLQVLSCWEAGVVPVSLLDPEVMSESELFPDRFDEAMRNQLLEAMAEFALVDEHPRAAPSGRPGLRVHRLVLETVHAELTSDADRRAKVWETARELLARAITAFPEGSAAQPHWHLLAPHCVRLVERCPELSAAVENIEPLSHATFDQLRKTGMDRVSARLCGAALDVASRVLGPLHPTTLQIRHDHALSLETQGRFAEALAEFTAVYEDRVAVLGAEDERTLQSRMQRSGVLRETGDRTEALREYMTLTEIQTRLCGPNTSQALSAANGYAISLNSVGRFVEGAAIHRDVLARRRRLHGPRHPDTLLSQNNLGYTLHQLGEYAEAETHLRGVLEIRQEKLGDSHPSTWVSEYNLAGLWISTGRLDEAEDVLRRVDHDRTRLRGHAHPSTLNVRLYLASIHHIRGLHEEAASSAAAVVEACRNTVGPNNPKTLEAEALLGLALAAGGVPDGEDVSASVLERRARLLGKDHPATLRSRFDMAVVHRRHGRYADAAAELAGILLAWETAVGAGHPDLLRCRVELACCRHLLGSTEQAEYFAEWDSLIEEFETRFGTDHYETQRLRRSRVQAADPAP